MLFPIKNREDLEKLEDPASLQNQVKVVGLPEKKAKQNFHEVMKIFSEPLLIQKGILLKI